MEWNRVAIRIPSLSFDACLCLHMRMTIGEGDLAEKKDARVSQWKGASPVIRKWTACEGSLQFERGERFVVGQVHAVVFHALRSAASGSCNQAGFGSPQTHTEFLQADLPELFTSGAKPGFVLRSQPPVRKRGIVF